VSSNDVQKAIRRWETKGLIPPPLGDTLRAEVEAEERGESTRWSQYLLAATGGAVLVIAAGTFLAWVWPEMGYGGQAATLGLVGVLVMATGVALGSRQRWRAVSGLLQVAGPVMIIMAAAWSENAWRDRSAAGIAAGLVVLTASALALAAARKQGELLMALQVPLSFLATFEALDRGAGLQVKTILWILDGVLLVALAWTAIRLRKPGGPTWLLGTFTAFLYASLVLLLFSGVIVWDLKRFAIIPVDIWLLAVAGLSMWGLQPDIPEYLRHEAYERQLAWCILLWIPFGFFTTLVSLRSGPSEAALVVAAAGALGLGYALPRGSRAVLVTACITLLAAAWYYGVSKAGALGAVGALAATAVLLLWASSRLTTPGAGATPATPTAT
jgi:hypothetical protein